jgi:hypothetical protein
LLEGRQVPVLAIAVQDLIADHDQAKGDRVSASPGLSLGLRNRAQIVYLRQITEVSRIRGRIRVSEGLAR